GPGQEDVLAGPVVDRRGVAGERGAGVAQVDPDPAGAGVVVVGPEVAVGPDAEDVLAGLVDDGGQVAAVDAEGDARRGDPVAGGDRRRGPRMPSRGSAVVAAARPPIAVMAAACSKATCARGAASACHPDHAPSDPSGRPPPDPSGPPAIAGPR